MTTYTWILYVDNTPTIYAEIPYKTKSEAFVKAAQAADTLNRKDNVRVEIMAHLLVETLYWTTEPDRLED